MNSRPVYAVKFRVEHSDGRVEFVEIADSAPNLRNPIYLTLETSEGRWVRAALVEVSRLDVPDVVGSPSGTLQ